MSLLSTWYALPQLLPVPDRHMDCRCRTPTTLRKIEWVLQQNVTVLPAQCQAPTAAKGYFASDVKNV